MVSKHHILLLGGTGICGLIFIRAALQADHQLTAYVRTPSKFPHDLSSNPKLTIIQGELGDEDGLKKAAGCGADVFVSLAGPTLGKREGTPITNAFKMLYPLILSTGTFKRILILSTPSYSAPQDTRSIKWFVSINFYIRPLGGDSYREIRGMALETVGLRDSIEWTVFRVPLLQGTELTEGSPEQEVNAVYVGDKQGRDGLFLERSKLVRWILQELSERKWIGLCPLVSNV